MRHRTSEEYIRSIPVSFGLGIFLGCAELAVIMSARIHPSWIIITAVAGVDLSICEVYVLQKQLPSPEQKVLHFFSHAAIFIGVALIGLFSMVFL